MIKWPEKAEYRAMIDEDLGVSIWYVLNELNGESKTTAELAAILKASEANIRQEGQDNVLVRYHRRTDSFRPFLRTHVVYGADRFFDERDLNAMLELRPSPIHGTGVFAKKRIQKDTVIRNAYKGVLRYMWELEDWTRGADCYNMSLPALPDLLAYCPLNKDASPAAKWENPYIFYVNHQSPPRYPANVTFYTSKRYPWIVWLKTTKTIRPGQELLLDTYGPTYEF